MAKIPIGISGCLLGQAVRFDGAHKWDACINETLSRYFEFVPFCPEVAIGLGVPRQPIGLVSGRDGVRVRGVSDPGLDVTDALATYARRVSSQLSGIGGYIFKRASPSCGMEEVDVYGEDGQIVAQGKGLYAKVLMENHPLLPCEEEGRLGDPILRENFMERVFAFHRWRNLQAEGLTPAKVIDFHRAHRALLMSHSQAACRKLDRLIARLDGESWGRGEQLEKLAQVYIAELMAALKRPANGRKHAKRVRHPTAHLIKEKQPIN